MTAQFFGSLFNTDIQLRHFSFARHALVEAFRLLRLKPRDKVLLPEYICRDLLAALSVLDLEPVWYPVARNLTPATGPGDWPCAKVVIAVNYFGFPQDLSPFDAYAQRTGAVVIEDNAHGFLSRDACGRLLGTRADLGLFSYRKTFLLGRGAGLSINCHNLQTQVPAQLPFKSSSMPREIKIRRQLQRTFGTRLPAFLLAKLVRLWRKTQGDTEIPPSAEDAECTIPTPANPDNFLFPILNTESVQAESERRRSLYKELVVYAQKAGLSLVYPKLQANTVPYGLALYGDNVRLIAKVAAHKHLDYFKWPDLPTGLLRKVPKHYSDIYLINFL
jgi:hypothetical protein